MLTIVVIVLLIVLLGGGFGAFQGRSWGAPAGGLGFILLLILIVLVLSGRL
jgi:hypothetical protein